MPLLTPAERFRLLVDWNDTGDKYPDKACIEELFAAQVERHPMRLRWLAPADSSPTSR